MLDFFCLWAPLLLEGWPLSYVRPWFIGRFGFRVADWCLVDPLSAWTQRELPEMWLIMYCLFLPKIILPMPENLLRPCPRDNPRCTFSGVNLRKTQHFLISKGKCTQGRFAADFPCGFVNWKSALKITLPACQWDFTKSHPRSVDRPAVHVTIVCGFVTQFFPLTLIRKSKSTIKSAGNLITADYILICSGKSSTAKCK